MVRKEGMEHFTEIKRNQLITLAEILHQIRGSRKRWNQTTSGVVLLRVNRQKLWKQN